MQRKPSSVVSGLKELQDIACEDADELLLMLLQDFSSFADDVIAEYGREPFLSTGWSPEIEIDGYFIFMTGDL